MEFKPSSRNLPAPSGGAAVPASMFALGAWALGILALLLVVLWFLVGFNVFGSVAGPHIQVDGNGNASVAGDLYVQGKLNLPGPVILDGIIPVASQNFVFVVGSALSTAIGMNFDQIYQFYGGSLHIQGRFIQTIPADSNSHPNLTSQFDFPTSFSVPSSSFVNTINTTGIAVGMGGSPTSEAFYFLSGCALKSSTSNKLVYTLTWIYPNSTPEAVVSFSYNITFPNVYVVDPNNSRRVGVGAN
jgi:hypothetical protein